MHRPTEAKEQLTKTSSKGPGQRIAPALAVWPFRNAVLDLDQTLFDGQMIWLFLFDRREETMKILMLYATSQGQTRKIMRHLAERFAKAGHSVELLPAAEDEGLDPLRFDAAILAGSIHAGRYQPALIDAARRHAPALSQRPGLFVSVSLTAAGDDPDDRKELARLVDAFMAETGWQGAESAHVPGAIRFTEYNFFEYWAMLWISRYKGADFTGKEDIEFTDWAALDALADAWLERIRALK